MYFIMILCYFSDSRCFVILDGYRHRGAALGDESPDQVQAGGRFHSAVYRVVTPSPARTPGLWSGVMIC